MKTKTLLAISFTAVVAISCSTSDRCTSFTPDDVLTINDRMDTTLYTSNEMILIGEYLMNYAIVHPNEEMAANPFAAILKENAEKSGFKDCDNLCEVLDYQHKKLKEEGISEDEFVNNFKQGFVDFNKGLDSLSNDLNK